MLELVINCIIICSIFITFLHGFDPEEIKCNPEVALHNDNKENITVFEEKSEFITNEALNRLVINNYIYANEFNITIKLLDVKQNTKPQCVHTRSLKTKKFRRTKENLCTYDFIRDNLTAVPFREGVFFAQISTPINDCRIFSKCILNSVEHKYVKFSCCVLDIVDNYFSDRYVIFSNYLYIEGIHFWSNGATMSSCNQSFEIILYRDTKSFPNNMTKTYRKLFFGVIFCFGLMVAAIVLYHVKSRK